jgi:hypothetical protein
MAQDALVAPAETARLKFQLDRRGGRESRTPDRRTDPARAPSAACRTLHLSELRRRAAQDRRRDDRDPRLRAGPVQSRPAHSRETAAPATSWSRRRRQQRQHALGRSFIDGGCLIVHPQPRRRYTRDELLAQCDPTAEATQEEDREWLVR